MTVRDYKKYFDNTTINYDTEGWGYDYFLSLDDNGSRGSSGKHSWCGSRCTRYIATVKNTSSRTNKVHVSANTWRERSYPETS